MILLRRRSPLLRCVSPLACSYSSAHPRRRHNSSGFPTTQSPLVRRRADDPNNSMWMRSGVLLTLATTVAWTSNTPSTAWADQRRTFHKESEDDCPFYGCPLTPQDVHYNTEKVKEAFSTLRQAKRADGDADAEALLRDCASRMAVTLTLIGYKGGPLSEQINQDRAVAVAPFRVPGSSSTAGNVLIGVFDGHAARGELVSEFVKNELPVVLSQKLSEQPDDIAQLLRETFVELDERSPAHESGGCTCTVVLTHENKVYVANAGDSRSFLVTYRPSTQQARVVYISREDKPHLPDERARVEAAGGQVYIPVRGTSRVVYHDPRTGAPSGLAMSRSIGDWAAGKLGVIPDPLVQVFDIAELVEDELSSSDKTAASSETYVVGERGDMKALDDVHLFAVSATDGMMDYLDAEAIANVLAHALFDDDGAHPITAAEHLVFAAANAWQQDKQGRYRDDIAIAASTIRIPPPPAGR